MAQGDELPSFDAFDERLRRARGEPEASSSGVGSEPRPMRASEGFQAGVEVIAGVVGGALIGYGLDAWLGSSPLCLILFFFLGAAAGVLNAYRTLRRFSGRPPS